METFGPIPRESTLAWWISLGQRDALLAVIVENQVQKVQHAPLDEFYTSETSLVISDASHEIILHEMDRNLSHLLDHRPVDSSRP